MSEEKTAGKRIKVLVVDDSRVARQLLAHLLEADPEIAVVGTVGDGREALDFVRQKKPDVVLMDIQMPGLDGFETTRQIMETEPLPIIICSAATEMKEMVTTFRVMEAGAVACVEKPVSRAHPQFDALATELVQSVKLMSEVKVVRRWKRVKKSLVVGLEQKPVEAAPRLVGIGASTGGPPVLQTVLSGLPKNFPLPILVVQHISHGFLPGLVEWLNQTTGMQIHIAGHGMEPLAGHVYFAPDDLHLGVGRGGRITLSREEPENGLRPAVSFLFRSLAEVCGPYALGVLLTGMGRDGADELKQMKDAGAVTIAQDRETSVVHGMPGEAILIGGATHILGADKIAGMLGALAARKPFNHEH